MHRRQSQTQAGADQVRHKNILVENNHGYASDFFGFRCAADVVANEEK